MNKLSQLLFSEFVIRKCISVIWKFRRAKWNSLDFSGIRVQHNIKYDLTKYNHLLSHCSNPISNSLYSSLICKICALLVQQNHPLQFLFIKFISVFGCRNLVWEINKLQACSPKSHTVRHCGSNWLVYVDCWNHHGILVLHVTRRT